MKLYQFLFSFSENVRNVEVKIINALFQEIVLEGTLFEVLDLIKGSYYSNEQVVQFKYSRSGLSVTVFTDKLIG